MVQPDWDGAELDQLVGVVERLVVDSAEWDDLPGAYERLAQLFDRVAVSDIAWTRTLGWRAQLAALWPGIRRLERVEVTGPLADASLLAGWLRSRLRRDVELRHKAARSLLRLSVDGTTVEPPPVDAPSASDLLSEQLDQFSRDAIYEAAVKAA